MTDNEGLHDTLHELIRIECRAIRRYSEAIEAVDNPEIRSRLLEFRCDHERHVDSLKSCVRNEGVTPPLPVGWETAGDTDGNGVLMPFGVRAALADLVESEEQACRAYEIAERQAVSEALRELLLRHGDDEKRHLRLLRQTLICQPVDSSRLQRPAA